MSVTIKTKQEVDERDLVDALFGAGADQFPWWAEWRIHDKGDDPSKWVFDIGGYFDPDDKSKGINWRSLNVRTLAYYVSQAIERGERDACTGRPITLVDGDPDWDACEADAILQLAVYGDVLFS
jgi:hypothetical protein